MNILIIMDNLSTDAGVTSIVKELYSHFEKVDTKFDFLICKENENSYADIIREQGSKVYCFGNPLSPKMLFNSTRNIKAFFREHAIEYDVVHLHSPTLALFTLKFAKKYGIANRIVHSHSTMMSPNKVKTIINNYLIRQIPKYANHYWACSKEAAEFLYGKEFCKNHNIELIKNAVDTKKFVYDRKIADTIRKKYHLIGNKVIMHISNFTPLKNHTFLIKVIKEVVEIDENFRFLFLGDGSTKNEFEIDIKNNMLDKYCIFTGRVENVENFMMVADAVILPSIKEGLPVTIVEAQAAGVPCYISDTITREADIVKITYLPLKTEFWVKALSQIEVLNLSKRVRYSNIFEKSEFNIEVESKRVEKLYLNMEK